MHALNSTSVLTTTRRAALLDAGLLLARLGAAAVFIHHGAQKLFGAFGGPGIEGFAGYLTSLKVPMPLLNAWLAGLAEFGGGVALALGLGTRLVGLPLTFTMAVAFFTAHKGNWSEGELAGFLGLSSLALALTGAGRLSLDHLIWRARK